MKKLAAITMMLLVLVGCSSSSGKEVTTVGQGSLNGMPAEVEIISQGDKVTKEKSVITMDLKTLGLTEEQAKESMATSGEKLEGIEGFDYKVETNSENVIVTTTIDYNKTDINELKNNGLLEAGSDAKFVSLKLTKENYEKMYGMTFEEK